LFYQDAGADVLYAPGLTSKEDIATVVRSVDRPVNVVMGLQGVQLSLAGIGVKRISVGSALSRARPTTQAQVPVAAAVLSTAVFRTDARKSTPAGAD
jgi:2-methylisocitrate lyase-like PEP mutase family enzyme